MCVKVFTPGHVATSLNSTPVRHVTWLWTSKHIATADSQDFTVFQVFYTGTLDDGSTFDSNIGQEPLQFEIGAGKVIPGFDDAVTGLSEGDKRKQHVPADRAYGTLILVHTCTLQVSLLSEHDIPPVHKCSVLQADN